MKAVAKFSREDFDRPINFAQFGITTVYFRYFIFDWYQLTIISKTHLPDAHMTAFYHFGYAITDFLAECGDEDAKQDLKAIIGKN